MTKTMLDQEWDMSLPAAIEAEAQAQAICMQTRGLRARLPRVPGQGAAGLRGRLMLDGRSSTTPTASSRRGRASTCRTWSRTDLDARCRALVRALARDGWLRARRRGAARRAHAVPRARDARPPRRAGRLRVRDAGARQRADLALRRRRAARARTCRRSRRGEKIAAFALSEPDAGSDVAAMTTTRGRRAPDRDQDLDLQRRDRRLLHRVRARARGHHARTSSRPRTSRSPSAST